MADCITYQVEPFHIAWKDMEPLFPLHWDEVALNQDTIKLNMYTSEYQRLANAGQLELITIRADGDVVGYSSSIVNSLLHYQHVLAGNVEMFYLLPTYRKGWYGYKLLKHTRDHLLRRGCKQIAITCKVHNELDVTKILERLRFVFIEKRFTLNT